MFVIWGSINFIKKKNLFQICIKSLMKIILIWNDCFLFFLSRIKKQIIVSSILKLTRRYIYINRNFKFKLKEIKTYWFFQFSNLAICSRHIYRPSNIVCLSHFKTIKLTIGLNFYFHYLDFLKESILFAVMAPFWSLNCKF